MAMVSPTKIIMRKPTKPNALVLIILFAALVGTVLFLFANFSTAYEPRPVRDVDNEVLRIAKGLYCPVCPATPLDVCDTQACRQWRDLIRQKLLAGEGEEQIRDYFVAQYGERVLGAPIAQGFNLGAYILPIVLLLIGGSVLFMTLRGWQRSHPTEFEVNPPIAPAYAERIARELKERE